MRTVADAIVVDVDRTLAGPPPDGDYSECAPNLPLIARITDLAASGFSVVINTSRGMRTYGGQVDLISEHTLPPLVDWLRKHRVPFDDVRVGKYWPGPRGLYVDDRSVRPAEFLRLSVDELQAVTRDDAWNPGDGGMK